MASKSARHRAKLRAKFRKSRARQCGQMKVKKAGGRMKRSTPTKGNRKRF
ncbi:MAG: hypothetical protein H6742_01855 [Alphaproteobacteria bacterium]|nr:hypothetical protein [Alphaproteobacteria bacterium]